MPAKANEYWAHVKPFREIDGPDFEPTPNDMPVDLAQRRECASLGHDWPEEDGLPCERCGKPSSLPAGGPADPPSAYVAERDALIPIAEAAANDYVNTLLKDGPLSLEEWGYAWTHRFHEVMDALAHHLRHAGEVGAPVHPRAKP